MLPEIQIIRITW